MASFINSPFEIREDPFWDAHQEARAALEVVGIHIKPKQRIRIFKIYNKLRGRQPSAPIEQAMLKLNVLLDVIRQGLEPESKNGKYY